MKLRVFALLVLMTAIVVLTILDVYRVLWRPPTSHNVYINLEQLITVEDDSKKNSEIVEKREKTTLKQGHDLKATAYLKSQLIICKHKLTRDFQRKRGAGYGHEEIDACAKNDCEANKKCSLKTEGRIFLDFRRLQLNEIDDVESIENLYVGGWYLPKVPCKTKSVAIIVPYRDREIQLGIFLRHYHRVLQNQQLHYRIFVVEQNDDSPFNRGKLMNVGYKEASKYFPFDCYVFHDVDLILEDDRFLYNCPSSPMHMSGALDKFNYKLLYDELFGGIEMFSNSHFKKVNGFSNAFWGWGAEDDNLYRRLKWKGLTLWRPPASLARYTMLTHQDEETKASPKRFDIRKASYNHFATDGLNSLRYEITSTELRKSHTLIKVDLKKEKDILFGV